MFPGLHAIERLPRVVLGTAKPSKKYREIQKKNKHMKPSIAKCIGDTHATFERINYSETLNPNKLHLLDEKNKAMSFNVPRAEQLTKVVNHGKVFTEDEKHKETQENNGLAITKGIGEEQENLAEIISNYVGTLNQNKLHCLGYPTNLDFNYDVLTPLLRFHLNNAGDPFLKNGFGLNSTKFEVCVLDWFANLWEIEKVEYWGYVTTGGTEGNLHGILMGREKFPDGILYTSQDSHYSIFKIARMYRMQCVKVGTLVSGTTMKGAIDDVNLAIQTLEESGFARSRFYIHCDAALFGMMLPFINRAPRITFKKPIGSVSISGHKFLGCPIPCGVLITRLEHINALSRDVEYIASRDVTIMGSRCGHAPIFIWYALKKKGLIGLKKDVGKCITNAHYLLDRLRDNGIGAMLNNFSNTVVFERPPNDEFVRRWNLACKGNIAHVVVMNHVTVEMLNSFVAELIQKRPIWFRGGQRTPPCIANDIGAENCACTLHNSFSCTGMHD